MPKRKRSRPSPHERQGRASIWDNRTRLLAIGLIAFAAILLVLGLRSNASAPAAASGASSDEPASVERGGGGSNPSTFGMGLASASPSAAPSAVVLGPPPVIDEVVLEKKEVCAGEENLITVKSHTVDNTDPFLHTVIDGKMGTSVPIMLWRDDDGNVQGQHSITVFGKNNVATTVPLPQYEVKNCRPTFIAAISQRLRSNTWSDFDFQARVVALPPPITDKDRQRGAPPPPQPKPFKPVAFTWTFGDGEATTTLAPLVEHDYEGRSQDALYSYFVIGVSIRGAKGETATGRMTLPLINPAFESLSQKGIVQLLIALDPRFPERGPDGRVTQKVRIWHNRPGPVTIDRVMLQRFYVGGAGQTTPEEVSAASVLGSTVIPPGKDGLTATVTLDPSTEDQVFTKTWSLMGTSAEGYPASGSFSVMLPPDKPGADAGDVIFDPLLKQKIILAREILGKDVVDDEDLWRLQREGMFDNLKVDPAQAAAAASAAIAAAVAKGPPSPQTASIPHGAPVPTSTSQQAAQPQQPGSGPATK